MIVINIVYYAMTGIIRLIIIALNHHEWVIMNELSTWRDWN